eukprot:1151002-Pelagomonas_calceolata.AAC.1
MLLSNLCYWHTWKCALSCHPLVGRQAFFVTGTQDSGLCHPLVGRQGALGSEAKVEYQHLCFVMSSVGWEAGVLCYWHTR